MLTGREQILEELIKTEVAKAMTIQEYDRILTDLAMKSKNLKAQVLVKVEPPQALPRQNLKKSTKQGLVSKAYEILAARGPMSISDLAVAGDMSHSKAPGCMAELTRQHVVRRLDDGNYELAVHRDQSEPANGSASATA